MAPWIRVGESMADVAEIISFKLVPEQTSEANCSPGWHQPPRIQAEFRNGNYTYFDFKNNYEAEVTFEALFKLLMPDAVNYDIEEPQNGA